MMFIRGKKKKKKPTTQNTNLGVGNLDNVPPLFFEYQCARCKKVYNFRDWFQCQCQTKSKYTAKAVIVNDTRFPSMKEAYRYSKLSFLAKRKVITELELQPVFKFSAHEKLICTYRADFRYVFDSVKVVEDTKGAITPVFKLKMKLLEIFYPDIKLVIL